MSRKLNKERTNVLIIGKSGVGKSSLVNYIFGCERQVVGVGAPVTPRGIKEFVYKYDEHFDIHIYDTWGLEPSAQKAEDWKKTILKEIELHDKQETGSTPSFSASTPNPPASRTLNLISWKSS